MIRIQTAAAINSDRSLATKWDLAKRARLKRAGIAQGRGYVIEHAARSIRMALIPAMGGRRGSSCRPRFQLGPLCANHENEHKGTLYAMACRPVAFASKRRGC